MRYLSLLLLLLFSCSSGGGDEIGLPFYNTAELTPEWIEDTDDRYEEIHKISDFEFVNQLGSKIDQSKFDSKIYIANFFFTTCSGVCPKMTNNLKAVYDAFIEDNDILMISHTVMPWVDGVEKLNEYAELKGVSSDKWDLVTGTKKNVYGIARGSYFADEGFGKTLTVEEDFLHTENVFLIDNKRRIRGVYNGTLPLEMRRLIEDVITLKKE